MEIMSESSICSLSCFATYHCCKIITTTCICTIPICTCCFSVNFVSRIWRERWIGKGFQMLPQHVKIKFKSQHGAKHYWKRKRKNSVLQCVESFPNGESYFGKFILGKRKLFQGSGNIGLHITKGCFPKQSGITLLLFSTYPTSLGKRS